jgi:hypothetical protein
MQHELSDRSRDQPIGGAADHHDEIRLHRSRGLHDRWAGGGVPHRSADQVDTLAPKLRRHTAEILGRASHRRHLRRGEPARQSRRVDGAHEDEPGGVVLLRELDCFR